MPNLRRWADSVDFDWLPPKFDYKRTQDDHGRAKKPMEIDVVMLVRNHVHTNNNNHAISDNNDADEGTHWRGVGL